MKNYQFNTFFLHTNTNAFSQSTVSTLVTVVFADLAFFAESTCVVLVLSDTPSKKTFTAITAYSAIVLSCSFVFAYLTVAICREKSCGTISSCCYKEIKKSERIAVLINKNHKNNYYKNYLHRRHIGNIPILI